MPRLALVGDYNEQVVAHRAIPAALKLARDNLGVALEWEWIGTDTITDVAQELAGYSGVWCVPASPYKSMTGALAAIRYARESGRPLLGTCGGFQHALIEFARNVAHLSGADHAETNTSAADLIVTPLACSLVGQHEQITFSPHSQLHTIFGDQPATEGYHCNYGVNAAYRAQLESAGLRFTGFDSAGQIRAMELPSHRFFIGTLFQPERSALQGRRHPLVEAFIEALTRPE